MTSKQRAYLKSLASNLDPIFQVGKSSLTPQVTEAINALEVALYEEGWISPDRLSDSVARNKKMLGLD